MRLILSTFALLFAASDSLFSCTRASSPRRQPERQDRSCPTNVSSHYDRVRPDEVYNYDDYDFMPSRPYRWLEPEHPISTGPSLATRMMEEEEEDTASTSMTQYEASTSDHQDDHQPKANETSEMDPTTLELQAQTRRRTVHSSVAWHAAYEDRYIDILRIFIDMIMKARRVDSRKSFKRIANALTPDVTDRVQYIYDHLDGWSRHEALMTLAEQHANMTFRYVEEGSYCRGNQKSEENDQSFGSNKRGVE